MVATCCKSVAFNYMHALPRDKYVLQIPHGFNFIRVRINVLNIKDLQNMGTTASLPCVSYNEEFMDEGDCVEQVDRENYGNL